MVAHSDRQQLVDPPDSKGQCRSFWCSVAAVVSGIALVALIIYGLLISLRHNPPPDLITTTTPSTGPSNECGPTEFDLFLLTLYWPPTYCSNGKCQDEPNKWVIHGLWPNYENGSWPQFCCNLTFDEKTVESLLPRMHQDWPNLIHVDEESLWIHEWQKHGTCCYRNSHVGGLFNYFNGTLSLFDKFNVGKWLSASEISPSSHKPVDTELISKSITQNFGKKIILQCDNKSSVSDTNSTSVTTDPSLHHQRQLLDSIQLCLDRYTLEPRDCPEGTGERSKCHGKIIYPEKGHKLTDASESRNATIRPEV